MTDPSAVDAYIQRQPPAQRTALARLRTLIRRVLPEAEEAISYGIIGFRHRGRIVVWIAGWKEHCSIYPLTREFVDAHDELKAHEFGKGTLRFRPGSPPPDAVIEALVRERAGVSD